MKLTLDLDRTSTNRIIQKANLLKVMIPGSSVYWRISANKRGGHICIPSTDIEMDEIYKIRCIMGDDPKRICKDITRSEMGITSTQVLFDRKTKNGITKHATKWVRI